MTEQSRIGGILMNWKKMTVTALIGLGVVGVLAGHKITDESCCRLG